MTDHRPNPRPMGFVSAMSDTNVHTLKNNMPQKAHYLKKAVTLESKADEKFREQILSERVHQNDHGGKQREAEFWERHTKSNASMPVRTPERVSSPVTEHGKSKVVVQ
ncbi:hypothetical protein GQ44DRAFT_724282 [Phaeosphaeriaceae sp. PMI808]|nr:hypothetical protein GQ44DRAFT_724282 [Phaeosphaeriaceae sp. PMI808]